MQTFSQILNAFCSLADLQYPQNSLGRPRNSEKTVACRGTNDSKNLNFYQRFSNWDCFPFPVSCLVTHLSFLDIFLTVCFPFHSSPPTPGLIPKCFLDFVKSMQLAEFDWFDFNSFLWGGEGVYRLTKTSWEPRSHLFLSDRDPSV